MRTSGRIGTVLVNGLLLAGLAALMVAYVVVVNDLPSRVYTPVQRAYLEYNTRRSIAQVAPTWNVILSADSALPLQLPVRDSSVRASLIARYEEQGGVSVTVYDLTFRGEYHLVYTGPGKTAIELVFPFPGNLETLHEVRFLIDGIEPADVEYSTRGIRWLGELAAGEEHRVEISYQADGASSFTYALHRDQRANVDVAVTVVGLTGSKVPQGSLPASASEATEGGEVWTWDYGALIADRDIRLTLPSRLSFAQRVAQLQDDFRSLSALAPVVVILFLASLRGLLQLSGVRLRLESYLLAGFGVALFYPLLTFASGVVSLWLAATFSLLCVGALLTAFLGMAAGWRRTGWQIALLLVVYLGFCSLGMLTRWRGLFLTGGGLLVVSLFMLRYARRPRQVRTDEEPGPATVTEVDAEPVLPSAPRIVSAPEPDPPLEPVAVPEPAGRHCPYCGRALEEDYLFCPACGHDTSGVRRCAACGHQQFVPEGLAPIYCAHCGAQLVNTSH